MRENRRIRYSPANGIARERQAPEQRAATVERTNALSCTKYEGFRILWQAADASAKMVPVMASIKATIEKKLGEAFQPDRLAVIDESHLHAGHVGSRPSGETHFRVEIVSPRFEGKSRVERQRMIYGALKAEMASSIHALSLSAMAPSEDPAV